MANNALVRGNMRQTFLMLCLCGLIAALVVVQASAAMIVGHGLYGDYEETADEAHPVGGSQSSFSDSDDLVVSWISLESVEMGDQIAWKWYAPNNILFDESVLEMDWEDEGDAWSEMAVTDLMDQPGTWKISVYVNDELAVTEKFTVTAPRQTPTLHAPSSLPSQAAQLSQAAQDTGDGGGYTPPLWAVTAGVAGAIGLIGGALLVSRRSARQAEPATPVTRTASTDRTSTPVVTLTEKSAHRDVFISYSTDDSAIATSLCGYLESRSISCWMAPRDILPGMNYQSAIIDAIDASRIVVLLFSSHSNVSPHVNREITRAVAQGRTIIPFRIEDVPLSKEMTYLISTPHWLDALNPPYEAHFQRLLETIQRIGRGSST